MCVSYGGRKTNYTLNTKWYNVATAVLLTYRQSRPENNITFIDSIVCNLYFVLLCHFCRLGEQKNHNDKKSKKNIILYITIIPASIRNDIIYLVTYTFIKIYFGAHTLRISCCCRRLTKYIISVGTQY